MRQFRTSGSVRGAAREGGPYRDMFKEDGSMTSHGYRLFVIPGDLSDLTLKF